jgi:hypothetical protein
MGMVPGLIGAVVERPVATVNIVTVTIIIEAPTVIGTETGTIIIIIEAPTVKVGTVNIAAPTVSIAAPTANVATVSIAAPTVNIAAPTVNIVPTDQRRKSVPQVVSRIRHRKVPRVGNDSMNCTASRAW